MDRDSRTLACQADLTMTARFLSRYGLLLAWVMLDGAVAIYLGLYGSNILSTFLLLTGIVVFGVAAGPGGTGPRTFLRRVWSSSSPSWRSPLSFPTAQSYRRPPTPFGYSRWSALVGLAVAFVTAALETPGPSSLSWALWLSSEPGLPIGRRSS